MGVSLQSSCRYEHVVFPAAARQRPLDLASVRPSASTARTTVPPQATDDGAFLSYLFSRAGLNARNYRTPTLRRRVPACLRALRAPTVSHARRLLQTSPSHVPLALGAVLVGVTSFFRDAAVFDGIARQLEPLLTDPARRVRVWSAGCSHGAELYSVAMLLAELNVLDRCELLGTDCRQEALIRAAAGRYDASEFGGVSPDRLARHFTPDAAGPAPAARLVRPSLRNCVTWRTADVLTDPEPGPWDLILCRNMAMYLRPHAADRLWHTLAAALRPGGVLVVGKAERPTAAARALTAVAPCVYRRGAAA
jgi:chemotaxis methyl-accepting protein methylase